MAQKIIERRYICKPYTIIIIIIWHLRFERAKNNNIIKYRQTVKTYVKIPKYPYAKLILNIYIFIYI